ncbi:MAG: aminopeptidase [Defluviitaleaceae bacterium]|nr:aminopeptidase [Defluviitaleaceae bacterium]
MDQRIEKLAKTIVNYSVDLKKGEKILIQHFGAESMPLVRQIVKEVYKVGGVPFVNTYLNSIRRELLLGSTQEQQKIHAEVDAAMMSQMDAYVGIRGDLNPSELADVPGDKMGQYLSLYQKKVHSEIRVPKTKWCVMIYPNYGFAYAMDTSLEGFEEFYYNVCNLDYSKLSAAQEKLVEYMKKTDKVRLTGPGTDISFSIKDMPPINCDGKFNIPDGEVYLAPVKNSVNGKISYNCPSVYQGYTYENVVFEFENGKIVKATANNTEKINEILDTDEGARYIGEFAIGTNPFINKPMKNTLFDEKIAGSIHLTPGNAYDISCNGNKSAVHWDLVFIQTPEYGGGNMYFDDVLVREDGRYIVDELKCLNPENFM